jgi:hypothetical protein
MEAIADLLVAGEQHGIGVTFTPDDVGWEVGYMQGMGGGDLASAYDLETAAKAALRPLMELAADLERSRRERGLSSMQHGPTASYGEDD